MNAMDRFTSKHLWMLARASSLVSNFYYWSKSLIVLKPSEDLAYAVDFGIFGLLLSDSSFAEVFYAGFANWVSLFY